ncbi:uncharacterized protein [Taeniopygia guttata]|uniref:uncharacterized protein n=1 Tax=Taeniopygia guttata TaxID=59729 RepID=UPI003BB960B7
MAGRLLGLFRVFRGKKKKSPEAAPPQQHENPEQFQPPEDDAALDHTEEKKPARGRFRKTLKTFWKFPRIRRRKTGSAAAEGPAEPDSGLTELQAEPDVSPDSPECSENSDTSVTETQTKALLMPEVVVITNTNNGETQGITNTDNSPDPAEPSGDSEVARNDQRAKADMAVTEDVDITNAKTRDTQGIANTDTMPSPTLSQELIFDYFKDPCVSSQQQQVPAKVKNIHQSLMSQVTVNVWLKTDILRLAKEQPADVVLTLLRCAPTCDRAAAMIWRTIGSSSRTVEKVLPALLCVMENWPLHSMCTSDGDNEEVFALAVPKCHKAMNLYSSRLFVALLFHVVITTQQIPSEEVATFWRACQEEHRLHCKPNRFAVQAMKVLLCRLQRNHVMLALELKGGWDMLLCADTQHVAVGLLARVLEMMSRHLRSECRERRRLALRGLVVLSKDPSMARRMYPLSQSLLELLGDADGEVVSMSLHVFTNVLQHKDILVSRTTAPKLAEALLLLFDHDSSYVHLLSIQLFDKMMNLPGSDCGVRLAGSPLRSAAVGHGRAPAMSELWQGGIGAVGCGRSCLRSPQKRVLAAAEP